MIISKNALRVLFCIDFTLFNIKSVLEKNNKCLLKLRKYFKIKIKKRKLFIVFKKIYIFNENPSNKSTVKDTLNHHPSQGILTTTY